MKGMRIFQLLILLIYFYNNYNKAMHNKKSINLKDLIPSLNINKNFSHSVDYSFKNPDDDEQWNNLERRYSLKCSKEQQIQHEFLSKIKSRNGARYSKQSSQQKTYPFRQLNRQTAPQPIKNPEIPQQLCNLNNNQKQKVIVGRITNFSPFGPIEQNDFYKYRNGFLFSTVCGGDPKQANKIKIKINKTLTPKKFKPPTANYLTFTQKNKFGSQEKLQKNSAKVIQLNPEFNKTKILQKSEQRTINQQNSPKRLSPYQLAVKKKSLNLIQKKLKGLGKEADDVQVHQIQELSKLFETSLMKQKFQNFLKFKKQTLIKNPIKIIHKYQRNQKQSQNKIGLDLNKFLTTELNQTQDFRNLNINLSLASKTIQIRDSPKVFGKQARSRSQQKVYRKLNKSQLFIRGSQIEMPIVQQSSNKS